MNKTTLNHFTVKILRDFCAFVQIFNTLVLFSMTSAVQKTKKKISDLLESLVEEYSEMLACFRRTGSKMEEMELFVSGKRHAISINNKIAEIYAGLVELKYNDA